MPSYKVFFYRIYHSNLVASVTRLITQATQDPKIRDFAYCFLESYHILKALSRLVSQLRSHEQLIENALQAVGRRPFDLVPL